ncbi:MAG: DUF4433 domain-containing protein [Hydrotalea sp.]|nr:DUF4433 domain-containing protein [Hydrotalea sp.]
MVDINKIDIYHIIHIDNLVGIVKDGGLKSDARLRRENKTAASNTSKEIKDARLRKEIPIGILGDQGNVGDYVPFYFCPRHPLLYEWRKQSSQHKAIYFVTKIESVLKYQQQCFFTNGNAASRGTVFYTDADDINKLNWDGIHSEDFARAEYPDNFIAKYSEFLIKDFVSLKLCKLLAVYDEKTKIAIEKVLQDKKISIEVKKDWYF